MRPHLADLELVCGPTRFMTLLSWGMQRKDGTIPHILCLIGKWSNKVCSQPKPLKNDLDSE